MDVVVVVVIGAAIAHCNLSATATQIGAVVTATTLLLAICLFSISTKQCNSSAPFRARLGRPNQLNRVTHLERPNINRCSVLYHWVSYLESVSYTHKSHYLNA